MLIPVKIKDSIQIEDIDIENTNFKSLNLREEHIEEFLRKNIEVIFQEETLLVVEKQVVNKENGRSDLTAVDENGNLVLIEIKRDVQDISCFELSPMKIEDSYFIDINRILPPPSLEDFYVEVEDKKRPTYTVKRDTPITRTSLPGMDKLFEWGIIKSGDVVVIKNRDNSEAIVIDSKYVNFQGEKLTFNKWGQKVTGWSSIRIYDLVLIKGNDKTLNEMRQEKMLSLENEIEFISKVIEM